MRDYYVLYQGESFILGNVPHVVFTDYDPGPTYLGGVAVPFVKKWFPVPNKQQYLDFLNTYTIYSHPSDPLIISYGLNFVNFMGGGRENKEDLGTPDAVGYTRHHRYSARCPNRFK